MFSLSPKNPYRTLPEPISTAKRHGPSRSPVNLFTPRLFSANADAHCAIAISLAPAQSIKAVHMIKVGCLNSSEMRISLSPSGTGGMIGTFINANILMKGIIAQTIGR